jgi:hypothetical protein
MFSFVPVGLPSVRQRLKRSDFGPAASYHTSRLDANAVSCCCLLDFFPFVISLILPCYTKGIGNPDIFMTVLTTSIGFNLLTERSCQEQ